MVFQQGYGTHAEIGLVGDNDLSLKVSADGVNFAQSLVVESASGKLAAKQGLNLSPVATDPASSVDGDLWYNSTRATFRAQQGGATVDLGSGVFSSSAFALQDSTDASKQAQFDLSALPTAATQSYGLPPMGGKLAVHGFFTSRAEALAWMATEAMPDGTMISISGFAFRKAAGAGLIADMPDWMPALEVYADHFAENIVPGTTDMSAAIQAALDYVGYVGGGVVKLWVGTYVAAGLSMQSQTFIVGQGIDVTTLKLRDGANTWLLATANYAQNKTYANLYGGVSDITLDGNKVNNPTGSLAWFSSYRARFFRARFMNSGASGLVLTAIMSDGTTMLANGMAENEIRNCDFDGNTLHGLHAYDGTANQVSDAEVMHCHFSGNGGAGIYAERCAGWKITHNQIYNSGTHCIFVHELARAVIQGNHLDLNPTAAAAGSRNACHLCGQLLDPGRLGDRRQYLHDEPQRGQHRDGDERADDHGWHHLPGSGGRQHLRRSDHGAGGGGAVSRAGGRIELRRCEMGGYRRRAGAGAAPQRGRPGAGGQRRSDQAGGVFAFGDRERDAAEFRAAR